MVTHLILATKKQIERLKKDKRWVEVKGKCGPCQYLGIDGGPGPVMVCNHPKARKMPYIISWVDGKRTPKDGKCPLKKGQ